MNKERLLNTFLDLVKINSETGNEEKIQPILKEKFESLGLKVEEDQASQTDGLGQTISFVRCQVIFQIKMYLNYILQVIWIL